MSDNTFDKILDSLIDEALPAVEAMPDKNLPEEMDVDFSPEFEERMQKIFKNERRKVRRKRILRYSRNIAACFLIFVVISGISIMSVEAFRLKFLNLVYNSSKTNTEISFEEHRSNRYESEWIALEYVPAGFSLEKSKSTDRISYLNFDNGEEYFDVTIYETDAVLSIDTEGGSTEKIKINDIDGIYSENDNVKSIVFRQDEKVCTVEGTIEKEELIKIAKNLKIL